MGETWGWVVLLTDPHFRPLTFTTCSIPNGVRARGNVTPSLPCPPPIPVPRPSPPPSLSPTLTSAANRRWEHKGRAPRLWTADCSTNFWTSGTFVPCLLCCVDAAGCWFSTEMWFLTQVLSAFTAGNGRYLPTTPPLVLGRWEWNIYINIYLYINVCISVNY